MNKTTDYDKFSAEITRTAEAFGAEMSPGRIVTYFDDMSDLSLDAVIGALAYARRSLTFFPKIAELRRYAEGSIDDRAELAWRTFVDVIRFHGSMPSLQVYDGAIAYAIECMGGWLVACEKVGQSSPEMVANYEKHFKNSYRLGAVRDEEPRYFLGVSEAHNRTLGTWKAPTIDQPVCLVRAGKIVKVVMPLDIAEGRLTAEARAALESGGDELRRYLPAPAPARQAIAPPAGAMATPEEVAELRDSIRKLPESKRPSNVVRIDRRG